MSNKQESSSWPHENDLVFRRDAIEAIIRETNQDGAYGYGDTKSLVNVLDALPSAQPELIEKEAYIRGFEQGRTQGMIDSQGGKK